MFKLELEYNTKHQQSKHYIMNNYHKISECPICSEVCVNHLHYGGISCYSCKVTLNIFHYPPSIPFFSRHSSEDLWQLQVKRLSGKLIKWYPNKHFLAQSQNGIDSIKIFSCESSSRNTNVSQSVNQSVCLSVCLSVSNTYLFERFTSIFYNSKSD